MFCRILKLLVFFCIHYFYKKNSNLKGYFLRRRVCLNSFNFACFFYIFFTRVTGVRTTRITGISKDDQDD